MSDFSFAPYRPELKEAWDKVVRRSRNGNFLHLRDYMDYHADRFQDASLLATRNGEPVAVLPCNRQGEQLVSHGGLTYAGLIYGLDLGAQDVLQVLAGAREHLAQSGAASLTYKAVPRVFHRYPAEEDLYALVRLQARLVRRDLATAVRIGHQPRLSDSRKNTIRKAGKHAVTVRESQDLQSFHAILAQALSRFEVAPVHTVAELQLLHGRFPGQIRLFEASQGGRPLAGALVYDFGPTVHTQYLASSAEGRDCGALDLLLHTLIGRTFIEREYLSFGISTRDEGRELNTGLVFQKEGFGGRGIVHDFYELALH